MPRQKTVALLFGGRSAEHDVSILSARAIFRNLDRAKYRPVSIYIDRRGRWRRVASPLLAPRELARGAASGFLPWAGRAIPRPLRADVYFPVLHGPYGEDGTIQGLLEMADAPYVGAGVLGSAVGMDKEVMKALFESQGLPIVPYRIVREPEWRRSPAGVLRGLRGGLRPPLFVKPANLGSSVGITKAPRFADAPAALDFAFLYDRRAIVETGIIGREFECSVLGNDAPAASLPGELVPHRDFYDYEEKYLEGKTLFHIPARLPAALTAAIRRTAVAAFRACGCEGMARVDFFLEAKTGRLFVNELNTIPGFTEISMYPKLWEATGLPFPRLVDRLIELGLERHRAKKRRVTRTPR